MIALSPLMQRFQPSASQAANQRARQLKEAGQDIVFMSLGEPDFPTPDNVKQAAIRALENDQTRYTNNDGTGELKDAIRTKFQRDNGLEYGADQVMAGAGAKQIIYNAVMATISAGDEVIVPTPHWASYPDIVRLAGGTPVSVACSQNYRFRLRPEDLEAAITERTKLLLLNSPNNPTGAVYDRTEMKALTDILMRHPHVGVITDDIYEHLCYGGHEFVTPAQVEPGLFDRTLTVNGVSKAYAMTGWRIGFAGGPASLVAAMTKLQGQSTSAPSSVSQAAAIEALTGPQQILQERRTIMAERRDTIFEIIETCDGLFCHKPEGAMYLYVSCAGVIGKRTPDGKRLETDQDFTLYLLETAGVSAVQGGAYNLSPYIRLSFPIDVAVLREGGRRIRDACAALD